MSSETSNLITSITNKRSNVKSFNAPVKRVALSDISNAQTPILVKDTVSLVSPAVLTNATKKEKKITKSARTNSTALQVRLPIAQPVSALVQTEIEEFKRKLEEEKERVRQYQKQILENEDKLTQKNEQIEALRQNIMYMACYNEYTNTNVAPETWTTKEMCAHMTVIQHLMKRDAQLTKKKTSGSPEDEEKKLMYLKELQTIKNTIELYGGLSSASLE